MVDLLWDGSVWLKTRVLACCSVRSVEDPQPEQLARAFIGLLEWAQSFGSADDDGLGERLCDHLGGDAKGLPGVSRALAGY
jgi:hypothetical protein